MKPEVELLSCRGGGGGGSGGSVVVAEVWLNDGSGGGGGVQLELTKKRSSHLSYYMPLSCLVLLSNQHHRAVPDFLSAAPEFAPEFSSAAPEFAPN